MKHISKPTPPFKLVAQLLKQRETNTPFLFVLRQMRGRNAANRFKPSGLNGRLDTVNTWSNTALQWWTDTRQRESWRPFITSHFISAAWFLFPLSPAKGGRSAEESEVRLKKKNRVCRLFHNMHKSWNWKIYRWGRFNVMLAHNVCQWLFCPWMSRMRAAGVTPHYTAFWKGYARLSEKKLLLFCQFKMSCFSGRIHVTLKNCTKRAQRREGDFWHSWSDFQWLSSLKLENALMVWVKKIKIFELWRQKLFKPFLCIKQIN